MKKVTILALHLGYGGVENAVATLANILSKKYEVEILSTYKLYSEPAYDIDKSVKITYLITDSMPKKKELNFYKNNKNYSMLFKEYFKNILEEKKLRKKIVSAIQNIKTDILISTRTDYNKLVSKYGSKKYKKIAWEHNHHNNDENYIKSFVKSCGGMNSVVLVSEELSEYYKKFLGRKVFYIPNALDSSDGKVSKLDKPSIISFGKLSKDKAFDDLLRVFKKVSNKYPDWHLDIIGDGLEKNNLLELTNKLKLSNKVTFHGFQNKDYINSKLCESSMFVMTSLTESFGLVLIEAMSYGLPCISYTSAQGANEIIEDGKDGFLIDDRNESEMVEKIINLIEDEKLRREMGKNAKKKSSYFSKEKVFEKWEKLLERRVKKQ